MQPERISHPSWGSSGQGEGDEGSRYFGGRRFARRDHVRVEFACWREGRSCHGELRCDSKHRNWVRGLRRCGFDGKRNQHLCERTIKMLRAEQRAPKSVLCGCVSSEGWHVQQGTN